MPAADAHRVGTTTPCSSSMRRLCWSCRIDTSMPTGRPPWTSTQREHCPAPQPISSTSLPSTSPSAPQVVLADALGTPEEAGVAEELAVGGLVLVGVGVPVGAVGPQRLRLVDRAPLGAYT